MDKQLYAKVSKSKDTSLLERSLIDGCTKLYVNFLAGQSKISEPFSRIVLCQPFFGLISKLYNTSKRLIIKLDNDL